MTLLRFTFEARKWGNKETLTEQLQMSLHIKSLFDKLVEVILISCCRSQIF
jgi:hypothetical protein